MTKLAIIVATVVAVSACSKKPALECGGTISGAVDRMLVDAKTNGKLSADAVARVEGVAPKMKEAIAKVCTEDVWGAAALECLDASKSQHDMNECEHLLTTQQKARVEAARTAVLKSIGRDPAAPPAPPTAP